MTPQSIKYVGPFELSQNTVAEFLAAAMRAATKEGSQIAGLELFSLYTPIYHHYFLNELPMSVRQICFYNPNGYRGRGEWYRFVATIYDEKARSWQSVCSDPELKMSKRGAVVVAIV
jgi:hypothetical protein